MLPGKIDKLKKDLVEYAALVEGMIEKSTRGLIQKKKELLDEVIELDEPRVNQKEIEMDEECTALIAQFQPAAKDLRTILMILKISNDLERLGDHAVNIAQSAIELIEEPQVEPFIDIPRMSEIVIQMVRDSIDAFVGEDIDLADSVCARDNEVDSLRDQLYRELITFMMSEPETITRALDLMRVSRNLERIADLSTNVCEDVIFMVEGRVIKHGQELEE
jgi:phosphate transport system protein